MVCDPLGVPRTLSNAQVHKVKAFYHSTKYNVTFFSCVEFPPILQNHLWEKLLLPQH